MGMCTRNADGKANKKYDKLTPQSSRSRTSATVYQ